VFHVVPNGVLAPGAAQSSLAQFGDKSRLHSKWPKSGILSANASHEKAGLSQEIFSGESPLLSVLPSRRRLLTPEDYTGAAPRILDAAFAALADPTRRAIVARLAKGEATVNELAEPFEMTQASIRTRVPSAFLTEALNWHGHRNTNGVSTCRENASFE